MESQKRMGELEMIKEKLKHAKDEATQSWLDSRPLVDELETMQAELSRAKERATKAEATTFELQAQLATIDTRIKSAKEEEDKHHATISNVNQAHHKTQEEMEQHKTKADEKRRRKSKLKQALRLNNQTLETLELTLEAIMLESEASGTSAAQALHYINNWEAAAHVTIQLRQEEYDVLKRRAGEQISKAEWRVSESHEEKLAAENNRDAAFARLKKLNPRKGHERRNILEKIIGEEDIQTKPVITRGIDLKKAKAVKSPGGVDYNNTDPIDDNNNKKKYLVKKKRSIFVRIKTFFVGKLSKYFK